MMERAAWARGKRLQHARQRRAWWCAGFFEDLASERV